MRSNRLGNLFLGVIHLVCFALPCAGQNTFPSVESATAVDKPKTHPRPQRHLYAGIHFAAQRFDVTSSTYPIQEISVRPLYVFAGYQIGPRLAVQIGFLQRNPAGFSYGNSYINQAGKAVEIYGDYDDYNAAVPVMLRYALTRPPFHRLHIDALLGITWAIRNFRNDYIETVDGQVTYEVHNYARSKNPNLTAGLGAELVVISGLGLMLEGTVSLNPATLQAGYTAKPTFGVGAGLRYQFRVGRSPE